MFMWVNEGQKNSAKFGQSQIQNLAKQGDLTDKQVKEVIKIAEKYQSKLLHQWKQFKKGKTIKIIKIKE